MYSFMCHRTGLARAQVLHAYISLLHEVTNEAPCGIGDDVEKLWYLDDMVLKMLSSMRHIEANYHKFESVAEGHWESLRAPKHCVVYPSQ